MPLYDYLCDICGYRFEEVFSIHDDSRIAPCPRCNPAVLLLDAQDVRDRARAPHVDDALRARPIFARKIITSFPGVTHGMVREAHWNKTVGQVVHNDAEFKSKLSEASDRESERNGFAVNFQPIDHHDAKEHLGVTDEGMDSTYSAQVDAGQREVTKHL